MAHCNTSLAPRGRSALAPLVVDDWPLRRTRERFQRSPAAGKSGPTATGQAAKRPWPIGPPVRTPDHIKHRKTERRINRTTVHSPLGTASHRLPLAPGQIHRRGGPAPLPHAEIGSNRPGHRSPVPRPPAQRYEHDAPGDLVHVDIKKLAASRTAWDTASSAARPDDATTPESATRICTTPSTIIPGPRTRQILCDEKKETAAGFWSRANDFFAAHHVTVTRVLTDNGSCYRSYAFADSLGPAIAHKRTRPYRPQVNGKVEQFNRTLAAEWAYADTYLSDEARSSTYQAWLHHYNHHRRHTGIGGRLPIYRVGVHNVPGNCTQYRSSWFT